PTTASEFADPTAVTTGYALCVYDATGLVLSTAVPGGGTCAGVACWKNLGSGFQYKDTAAATAGIQKILLKGNDTGKPPKALVKGKGINLPDPTLSLSGTVTAQLINTST